MPLPRTRAWLTLVFASGAFLSLAGFMSFASGSPDTHSHGGTGYWAVLCAAYFVTFGGAGLIGAFPRLARWEVKLAWLVPTAALYAVASVLWQQLHPTGAPPMWKAHVPALLVVLVGVLWGRLEERETTAAPR